MILILVSKVSHVRHACKHEPCNDKYVFKQAHIPIYIIIPITVKFQLRVEGLDEVNETYYQVRVRKMPSHMI